MQVINVTKPALCSEAFTYPMLEELAVRYLGMTQEAVAKLSAQRLAKGSADMQKLGFAKLRTVILNKLDNGAATDPVLAGWEAGTLTLEFACLPDLKADKEPDIGAAGANNRKRTAGGARKAPAHTGGVPRTGKYKVNKRTTNPSSNGGDAGKWAIWEHIWSCTSFEEYFTKAPAKSTKASGTVITASSEMLYAMKNGWIVLDTEAEQGDTQAE